MAHYTTLHKAIAPCQAWIHEHVDVGRGKCCPKVGGAAVDTGTIARDAGQTADAITTSGKTADLWFLAVLLLQSCSLLRHVCTLNCLGFTNVPGAIQAPTATLL